MRKNWLSKFINRQVWIIKLFALIGAGYILSLSYQVFLPEIKLIINQIYVKKTIIIGTRTDVAFAQSTESDNQGENVSNQERFEVGEFSIEQRILNEAKKTDFKEIDTLVAIAKCESSFNPACEVLNNEACVNPKNNSFDRGVFQISRKYHPEVSDECAFNVECSTREAIRIAQQSGFNQWACYDIIK